MRRHVTAALLACLVGWASGVRPAQAIVMAPATLNELVREARVIARGRVVEVRTQLADGRRRVERVIIVEAHAYMKGDFGPRFAFKVPGGELGRYQSLIIGAPSFREGEDIIVFLDGEGPAVPHLVGFSQGVLRVRGDGRTAPAVVLSVPADWQGAGAQPVIRGDGSRTDVPVEQFESRVRRLAAELGGPDRSRAQERRAEPFPRKAEPGR